MKMKAMSDGEVNNAAWDKMMGDLDGIEADGLFSEDKAPQDHTDGIKMEANGMSIHVKPMNGEQTEDMPKVEDEEEDTDGDALGKLGL